MKKEFIAGSGGGGGKGGGGGSRTPSTDPDSLNSRAFGRIVDLISEGEIEGLVDDGFVNPISGATDSWMRSIFLDNTLLRPRDLQILIEEIESARIGANESFPSITTIEEALAEHSARMEASVRREYGNVFPEIEPSSIWSPVEKATWIP